MLRSLRDFKDNDNGKHCKGLSDKFNCVNREKCEDFNNDNV